MDLVELLLAHQAIEDYNRILAEYEFNWHNIVLHNDKFVLKAILTNKLGEVFNLRLVSSLTLNNGNTLLFNPIKIDGIPYLDTIIINNFEVDLGTDVELEQLILNSDQLSCLGRIKVVS